MKVFRGRRDELQQRESQHDRQVQGQPFHPSKSHRHLQKVDLIFSGLEPDAAEADSTADTPPLQTSPLPFQQSQSVCPGVDNVYGYSTLTALRDDLRVYFEIIHGKPPLPSQQTATTAGTAIPPPLFTTVSANEGNDDAIEGTDDPTGMGTTDTGGTDDPSVTDEFAGGTDDATTAATGSSLAAIISTTAASGTVTDIAVTTAAALPAVSTEGTVASTAAKNGVRKRIRQHLHENDRRMQIAAAQNEIMEAFDNALGNVENITLDNVVGTLLEGMTGHNATSILDNFTGDHATQTLEDGGDNITLTAMDGNINSENATQTMDDGNITQTIVDGDNATQTAMDGNITSPENATQTTDYNNTTQTMEDGNVTQTTEDDNIASENATQTLDDGNGTQTVDGGENATQTVMDGNVTSENATEWDTNFTTTSLSTGTYVYDSTLNATSDTLTESTAASNPNLSVDFEIEPSIPVQFNICPGVFNFESASGNADPIVFEALTWNPVWLRCVDNGGPSNVADNGGGTGSAAVEPSSRKRNLAESSCVFSGGNVHMLFNNYGSSSSTNSTQGKDPTYHPLSITGISFQGASQASVSMYDPRGQIAFEDCQWTSMTGAALVIDGKYVGTYVQGSSAVDTGSSGGGTTDGSRTTEPAEDDLLQQFYQDIATPAPFTANPSPAPNSEPTTDPPNTPFPTTVLRIPASPTVSPQPTTEANILNRPPEGGYTGPPTLTSLEGENITETSSTEESFLLPTTIGSGTTAFVDSSTTWHGSIESTSTTYSTEFGAMTETLSSKIADGGADINGNQTDDSVQADGDGQTDDDGVQYDDGGLNDDGGVNVDDGGQDDVFSYTDDFAPRLLESDSLYFDYSSIDNVETDEARLLKVDNTPKSIIKLLSCSFRENTGPATIILTSQHDKMTTKDTGVFAQNDDIFEARAGDVPMVHSIHLMLEDSTFDSENVKGSVIVNDGGRLQTSDCMFLSNTANSIIQIKSGTLAMSRTEFTENTITGDKGLVEIDGGSTLESNENNCDTTNSSSTIESNGDLDTPVSTRILQDNSTDIGGEMMDNETLSALTSTSDFNATMTSATIDSAADIAAATSTSDVNATESEFNLMDNTTEGVLFSSVAPPDSTTCAGILSDGVCRKFETVCATEDDELLDEALAGCLSDWDDLVTAVRERLEDERDFMICPGTTMDIESSTTKAPVVIDSDYITITCGANGSFSDECAIVGGVSQFKIIGTSSGVELAGLTFRSSSGSSIIAAGAKDATLHLKNCEWASSTGKSVVLITSESATGAIEDALDLNELMSATDGNAMAVEITDCIFKENTVDIGIISNFGGTLTVYKTLFDLNTAKSGEIVVANRGSCKVEESCFDSSSSSTPGIIFVEFGSAMSANKNNFGINNTSAAGNCDAIFQQNAGKSCLGNPALCNGTCRNFTKTTCSLPMYGKHSGIATSEPIPSPTTPTPVNKDSAPSQALASQPESPQNVVPIIVASLVSAFIVFGLAGIVWHRKIKRTSRGGSRRNRSNPFNRSSGAQDDDLNDAYDGDNMDEVY
ncbi:hypothetical protein ACHAWX_006779 [Stephanocyclus meneghinianus]